MFLLASMWAATPCNAHHWPTPHETNGFLDCLESPVNDGHLVDEREKLVKLKINRMSPSLIRCSVHSAQQKMPNDMQVACANVAHRLRE